MQDAIERQITVSAPIERVFDAITDPKKIVAWFPDAVEGTIAKGESPVFDFGNNMRFSALVVDLDPHTYFAYRWVSTDESEPEGFVGDVLSRVNTLVEFRLSETSAGTLVTLKESGFAAFAESMREKTYADHVSGWEYMLPRLAKLVSDQ